MFLSLLVQALSLVEIWNIFPYHHVRHRINDSQESSDLPHSWLLCRTICTSHQIFTPMCGWVLFYSFTLCLDDVYYNLNFGSLFIPVCCRPLLPCAYLSCFQTKTKSTPCTTSLYSWWPQSDRSCKMMCRESKMQSVLFVAVYKSSSSIPSFWQLQKLDEVINLCLHHVSHKDNKIRGIYLDLLAKIPLSSISHALCTAHLCDDSEYTANKVCHVLVLEVIVIKI